MKKHVSEKDFQGWIVGFARLHKWKTWHVPAPMRAIGEGKFVGAKEAAGLADLIMLHDDPPRLIFAEVKGTGGRLEEAQRDFLKAASAVAEEARGSDGKRVVGSYFWQPGDEPQIETVLKGCVLL